MATVTESDRPVETRDVALTVEGLTIVLDPSGVDVDDEVSLQIRQGEVLGLVGESASGKTTAATSLLAHQRRGARIAGGRITIDGRDILALSDADLRTHPRRSHQLRAAGLLGIAQPGPPHRHPAHGDPRGAPLRRVRRASASSVSPR